MDEYELEEFNYEEWIEEAEQAKIEAYLELTRPLKKSRNRSNNSYESIKVNGINPNELYTPQQLAPYLHTTPRKVIQLYNNGYIDGKPVYSDKPKERGGKPRYYFKGSEVVRFINGRAEQKAS